VSAAFLCLQLAVLSGFFLLVGLAIRAAVRAQRLELERFAAGLEGGRVAGGVVASGAVEGRLEGRELRVALGPPLVASAAVAHPAAELELIDAGGPEVLARRLGLLPPAASFPAAGLGLNLVARAGADGAARLLGDEETRRAVLDLFERDGARALTLRDGWLRASLPLARPQAQELERLARRLCRLAALCDRRPLASQGDRAAPVFAWTGGGEAARCPWCHDELDPAQDAAGCAACGTLHHRACLAEAGGCTVFGCRGRPRGPVRG
jgi:hypothetical protein